jgi:glycosyltransferase involved in cell wall biosynthesis
MTAIGGTMNASTESSANDDIRLPDGSAPKVAIVHDWLATWRGGETVVAEILRMYPDAQLFALVDFLSEDSRQKLQGRRAVTSFLQRLPGARSHFRRMLPLFPRAIESLNVSGYDVVISSSHAVAKGVRTSRSQLHICYCYTPMRYAWDLREQYLEQAGLDGGARGWLVRRLLARLRAWDRSTSERVDHFVAISDYIALRIRRAYDRSSAVIYPPVSAPHQSTAESRGETYVTVSQLVPYKRVDLIIDAFASLPERELVIIGDGPERSRLEAALPSNVRLLGSASDRERDRWIAIARAFVFAAEEDFGIAPLEAQAQGTPVIAFGRGGSAETIRGLDTDTPTGVLFEQQTSAAIVDAIRTFEANAARISPHACRANAQRFAPARFRRELRAFVAARWRERLAGPRN